MHLAATVGTLLVWVGKRVFASTLPDNPVGRVLISYLPGKAGFNGRSTSEGGAQNDELRFREPPPARRSVEQLRGLRDPAFARRMHYWRNNMV